MVYVNFECPWCSETQYKEIAKNAEIEVRCKNCKKSIGLVTNDSGELVRVGQLTSLSKLLKSSGKKETSKNTSAVSIGKIYGNVSFGGDAVTNIYNETIRLIDETNNMKSEQKSQAKSVLEFVKDNASPFLPIIAEAIKKTFGL